MEHRAHSHFKNIFCLGFIVAILFTGCFASDEKIELQETFAPVDVSVIPGDTISMNKPELRLDNGIYYLKEKPFSGFIKAEYENNKIKSIGTYYLGKQHGITKTYYITGQLRDSRSYKANIGYGRHYGYWENGNMKFDFTYYYDKREGVQKQWYDSGHPYAFLRYKDDKEDGMQQAWRENGEPYINYEAKDGFRYGLQKTVLCYELVDQKVKTK